MAANSALTKITTRAKQIRRAHPSMTWMACVKKASAEYRGTPAAKKSAKKKTTAKRKSPARKKAAPKKRAAAVGKVRKKAAPRKKASPAPRKVKVKIKKNGTVNMGISGVSMSRLGRELADLNRLESSLTAERAKHKGTKDRTVKAAIMRHIAKIRVAIAASKRHITALKRTI